MSVSASESASMVPQGKQADSTHSAQSQPNANGNLFEFSTIQASVIKSLIEALKEHLPEANFEFDSTGIRIVDVDETHTVLTYLRLLSERFEYAYCPVRYILGINMMYLFKLIKTITNTSTLTLFLPANNPNKLGIRAEDAEKGMTQTWMMKLFDTNVSNIELPNISFSSIIHMPSASFQKICRDFSLADKLEIRSSSTDLIFRCLGEFVDGETVVLNRANEGASGVKVQNTTNSSEIVQGIFELKYLGFFTKCTSLCPTVEIFLKNDYPIILRYYVGNLGEVRFVLAPLKSK